MKPHHPILKGKLPDEAIIITATTNQTIAKPHNIKPIMKPIK